jgi:hypothetical protein
MDKPEEISTATNPEYVGDLVPSWDLFIGGVLDFNDLSDEEKVWARDLLDEDKK